MSNIGAYNFSSMIIAMALTYGGLAQIIVGVMEQKRGKLFGMTVFLSYGSFWLSLAFINILEASNISAAPSKSALGCYLVIWGFFSLIMTIASIVNRSSVGLTLVFVTLTLLYIILASA